MSSAALDALGKHSARNGLSRTIPFCVLIETPSAVHDAWAIASLPGIASLDFGTLDFVSAITVPSRFRRWKVPASSITRCCVTPRPKCAAALAHAIVPAHGVTRSLDDPDIVYATRDVHG